MRVLCYLPNTLDVGHRGDAPVADWGSLAYSTELAQLAEGAGFAGALLGTGWGRPDTFTVATALAARTETFAPLVAVRPGYWSPAQFANAAATLDALSQGRLLVNVVSGADHGHAYGDPVVESADRYARTAEFLAIVRALWRAEAPLTWRGEHFWVEDSLLSVGLSARADGLGGSGKAGTPATPTLYFGGASAAAEAVAATEADVQLFWGEPLAAVAERIDRLRGLEASLERRHAPLEFGLRITAVVRETSEEAWAVAEAKLAAMRDAGGEAAVDERHRRGAVGQRRLLELAERGEVLDTCLYTAPGRYGGAGAASTWLVGSAEEVRAALAAYAALGITHFILSDTPYRSEIPRHGELLLPRLGQLAGAGSARL